MARPMANDAPFATLNHSATDWESPREAADQRIGITPSESFSHKPSLIWFTTAERVWLASPVTLLSSPSVSQAVRLYHLSAATSDDAARCCALAKAIWRDRTYDLTSGFGGSGATVRDTGHTPNFSLYM
jgi:hypothetical protein